MIVAAVGGEMSSNTYKGLEQTYRGFLKERGLQMAEIDLKKYVKYAEWLQTVEAKGIRTDQLTNMISGYFTLSYSYKDYYTLNFNTRVDASNKFGSRANDKFLPIWSVSGRLNLKEAFMERANWVNTLALRASFGYQGNMLDSETVETVIKRGCDLLENIQLEENIKVYFNLRGRKWENNGQVSYFTNLEGWRIEKIQEQAAAGAPVPEYRVEDIPPMPEADDLPF